MELPTEIGNLSNIVSLVLSNNYLSGEIPTWLFDFNNLTELFLEGNKFVMKNARIAPRSMLNILSLGSCNLLGQIPIWISTQTQLMFLDLSDNNIEGTLPQWLFQSLSLIFLLLSNNNLSGVLPDTIGEATEMNVLMLSGNHFSEPIPITISNMFHLVLLDLSSNIFSGNEFPIFNPNPSLVYIDLSSNILSGQPESRRKVAAHCARIEEENSSICAIAVAPASSYSGAARWGRLTGRPWWLEACRLEEKGRGRESDGRENAAKGLVGAVCCRSDGSGGGDGGSAECCWAGGTDCPSGCAVGSVSVAGCAVSEGGKLNPVLDRCVASKYRVSESAGRGQGSFDTCDAADVCFFTGRGGFGLCGG
ncbi:receptor-like protein 46 [Hevea brasiliensis]|uniref:receptor-like protein 46 n=1 Tax=Hevea brasiliensis TaxID=3981 RepID=UPI0025D81F81|nr:receptor-like protein 46 [Hevea brasiliensis]